MPKFAPPDTMKQLIPVKDHPQYEEYMEWCRNSGDQDHPAFKEYLKCCEQASVFWDGGLLMPTASQ